MKDNVICNAGNLLKSVNHKWSGRTEKIRADDFQSEFGTCKIPNKKPK
jgi:hypothetical protein